MVLLSLLALWFCDLRLVHSTRVKLSSIDEEASSCTNSTAVRRCAASFKNELGVAVFVCRDFHGKELNWRCHCPPVNLHGQEVQSHVFTGDCSKRWSWSAELPSTGNRDSGSDLSTCKLFLRKLMGAMQLWHLFGPSEDEQLAAAEIYRWALNVSRAVQAGFPNGFGASPMTKGWAPVVVPMLKPATIYNPSIIAARWGVREEIGVNLGLIKKDLHFSSSSAYADLWETYVKISKLFESEMLQHNVEHSPPLVEAKSWSRTQDQLEALQFEDVSSVEIFTAERHRLKQLELVDETSFTHQVQSNQVHSLCKLSLAFLWKFQASSKFNQVVANSPSCDAASSTIVRDTLVDDCFGECIALIRSQQWMPSESLRGSETCVLPEDTDLTPIYGKGGCSNVPSDTIASLLEWVIQQRCWSFSSPSLLWKPDDREAHYDPSQPHPVCTTVDHGETARWSAHHTCPEGTFCSCPAQDALSHTKTIQEIRSSGSNSFAKNVTTGVAMTGLQIVLANTVLVPLIGWIASHTGSLFPLVMVANLIVKVARQEWVAILSNFSMQAVGAMSNAIVVQFLGMPFIVQAIPIFFAQGVIKILTKGCAATIGCWAAPVHGNSWTAWMGWDKGLCAMSEAAKTGGSSVWFLPPPGTLLRYSGTGFCHHDACDAIQHASQVIGFQNEIMANCQPLNFEAMDTAQKTKFVTTFRSSCIESSCSEDRLRIVEHMESLLAPIARLKQFK